MENIINEINNFFKHTIKNIYKINLKTKLDLNRSINIYFFILF